MTSHERQSVLCEVTMLDSERCELISAYQLQRSRSGVPSLGVQIFERSARTDSTVAVYLSHAADLLQFSYESHLEWLTEKIVSAFDRRRKDRLARTRNQDFVQAITPIPEEAA